jgi:hypothetical protein
MSGGPADTGRMPVATGGCQCGAVRYALYVAPQKPHVCHCRMCQRATGGLFAALAGAPKDEFAWTRGAPGLYASSNQATRPYCRDCGTPLGFAYHAVDARQYVTIGSLDEPARVPITTQYGIESRIPWVSFCEQVAAEPTGADPADAPFLAALTSHQDR